jgi:glycosyltransferase involved in cell wall biosynthesis
MSNLINQDKFQSQLTINENNENLVHGGLRLKNIFKKKKNYFLISIITVVFNGEKYLEETIKSVINQTNKNFEYIIVDGGSTDGTLDIIKKYDQQIDYWISQKDKGIYDAFNKGLTLVSGDVIGIVNSDDTYNNKCFETVQNYFKKNDNLDFLFGGVKKRWGTLHGYKPWKIFFSWGFYTSHSTGFFIKTNSAKKLGFYNLKYKYSSDFDLFYRMIVKHKMNGTGTKKDEIFGNFRSGGFSSKVSFKDHFKEGIKIRLDNGQNKIIVGLIIFLKFIKNIRKFL